LLDEPVVADAAEVDNACKAAARHNVVARNFAACFAYEKRFRIDVEVGQRMRIGIAIRGQLKMVDVVVAQAFAAHEFDMVEKRCVDAHGGDDRRSAGRSGGRISRRGRRGYRRHAHR